MHAGAQVHPAVQDEHQQPNHQRVPPLEVIVRFSEGARAVTTLEHAEYPVQALGRQQAPLVPTRAPDLALAPHALARLARSPATHRPNAVTETTALVQGQRLLAQIQGPEQLPVRAIVLDQGQHQNHGTTLSPAIRHLSAVTQNPVILRQNAIIQTKAPPHAARVGQAIAAQQLAAPAVRVIVARPHAAPAGQTVGATVREAAAHLPVHLHQKALLLGARVTRPSIPELRPFTYLRP